MHLNKVILASVLIFFIRDSLNILYLLFLHLHLLAELLELPKTVMIMRSIEITNTEVFMQRYNEMFSEND